MFFSLPQSSNDDRRKRKMSSTNKKWEMNKSEAKHTLKIAFTDLVAWINVKKLQHIQ